MNCPVCKTQELKPVALKTNLSGMTCPSCLGHWLRESDYTGWLEARETILPAKPASASGDLQAHDVATGKICPTCSRILGRYAVGRETDFSLESCAGCGGVWFDRNEWEILSARDLHDEIHIIFCASYQRQLSREASRKKMDALFRERLGDASYMEIKRIRAWMDEHPQKDMLLGFLTDPDPYRAS